MWKTDKNGKALNEPIDMYNHAMDAMRYGLVTRMKQPVKKPAISLGRADI
jgi:phage terminase large subunit